MQLSFDRHPYAECAAVQSAERIHLVMVFVYSICFTNPE